MNALVVSLITINLFFGSSGAQVLALQQTLNKDPDTRVASAGLGSPGNETTYFGSLTKSAVARFQEKYYSEILAPAGLTEGSGYVGLYTRTKLNALSATTTVSNEATSLQAAPSPSADYVVRESEKIDIYAGDKILENVRNRIYTAVNAAVASHAATITMPTITAEDAPSVAIGELSPSSGTSGIRVSITGMGISSDSVIYFGGNYIVRTISKDLFGNFSFIVPPILPAKYDIAIKTGGVVSNTAIFVLRDPKNPSVHLQSVSPATISYGDTLTLTGSGFALENNTVVTTYQTFANVPSADGKTLIIQPAPESMRESAKIGPGTQPVPMSVYVVNDYGFSDSEKPFSITI